MRKILSLMLVVSAAPALAEKPAKAQPTANTAAAPGVDMNMWESQTLGAVYGTFCGYYQDRITLLGQAVHLKDFKQCTALFDGYAKKCVGDLKAAGEFHVATPDEGQALGGKLGGCIGQKFDDFGKGGK
jgi:hypothetical protein